MSTKRSACGTCGALPMPASWSIRTRINQLEGGIIQSASWVLKEQVRFDDGVSSFDWEPTGAEIQRGAGNRYRTRQQQRRAPLGAGEATAGPTAAAIGNAVSHALGARIRDLPLTRERIMAALLEE